MRKQLWYHIKQNLVMLSIAEIAGALFGFILNYVIMIVLHNDEDGSAMIATMMGLMLGLVMYVIGIGFNNINRNELALMMSQTRKSIWINNVIGGLIEFVWLVLLTTVIFLIDRGLQMTLYAEYSLELNMTGFMRFFYMKPILLLVFFAVCLEFRLLIEGLSVKLGAQAFFAIWMVGCLFFTFGARSKWFSKFVLLIKDNSESIFENSAGVLMQMGMLVVCIILVALNWLLVNKQEVK